ncbi:NADH:ubiquinone reductase (Na(+)-transporting) subunit C [Persicobacter psychrovividus]|uniref:Na(+)-translocating NADH-quinone reductase subunit C n=1 Tax=Persicobacter psychrovividus TaxID=387638 RepID=A0ABN6L601_9BACT|nr:Na(+)-translocating NADH-quinone reductase subunit C [Persicobacter psychrovividus]
MRQSNGYIIGFAVVMTIVCGGLLSWAAVGLKEAQTKAKELDTKRQILSAVIDIKGKPSEELLKLYDSDISAIVIDAQGKVLDGVDAATVNIAKEYKKKPAERKLPIYEFKKDGKISAYILPMYGSGLWDAIWGFIAIESDGNTVQGISLDHKGETPGLGARITSEEVQERYKDKKIFEGGKLVSVQMVKGENNPGLSEHQVDGMSGATLTGNGVNKMLESYLDLYKGFLKEHKAG